MRSKDTLAVYVPGLGGDAALEKQRAAVKRWGNNQRQTLFLEPEWKSSEDYADKEERLLKAVQDAADKHKTIFIVGTSAGGSLGLNLFIKLNHPDKYFRSVCGKLKGAKRIGPKYSKPHPALIPSVRESERLASRITDSEAGRIKTYQPLFDEVVPLRDMSVKQTKQIRLLLIIHSLTIWLTIRFFYRKLLR